MFVVLWFATFYTNIRESIKAFFQDVILAIVTLLAELIKITIKIFKLCKNMFTMSKQ